MLYWLANFTFQGVIASHFFHSHSLPSSLGFPARQLGWRDKAKRKVCIQLCSAGQQLQILRQWSQVMRIPEKIFQGKMGKVEGHCFSAEKTECCHPRLSIKPSVTFMTVNNLYTYLSYSQALLHTCTWP